MQSHRSEVWWAKWEISWCCFPQGTARLDNALQLFLYWYLTSFPLLYRRLSAMLPLMLQNSWSERALDRFLLSTTSKMVKKLMLWMVPTPKQSKLQLPKMPRNTATRCPMHYCVLQIVWTTFELCSLSIDKIVIEIIRNFVEEKSYRSKNASSTSSRHTQCNFSLSTTARA